MPEFLSFVYVVYRPMWWHRKCFRLWAGTNRCSYNTSLNDKQERINTSWMLTDPKFRAEEIAEILGIDRESNKSRILS